MIWPCVGVCKGATCAVRKTFFLALTGGLFLVISSYFVAMEGTPHLDLTRRLSFNRWELVSGSGLLVFAYEVPWQVEKCIAMERRMEEIPGLRQWASDDEPLLEHKSHSVLGAFVRTASYKDLIVVKVGVPFWLATIFAAIPYIRSLGHRLVRRARYESGLCLECGYDLRAYATLICPECGTPIPPSQKVGLPPPEDRSTTPR